MHYGEIIAYMNHWIFGPIPLLDHSPGCPCVTLGCDRTPSWRRGQTPPHNLWCSKHNQTQPVMFQTKHNRPNTTCHDLNTTCDVPTHESPTHPPILHLVKRLFGQVHYGLRYTKKLTGSDRWYDRSCEGLNSMNAPSSWVTEICQDFRLRLNDVWRWEFWH